MKNEGISSLLLHDFGQITALENGPEKSVYSVSINPKSQIFQGHFPGNPICPGVCHIELIRYCSSLAVSRNLQLATIKKCRFTSVVRPTEPVSLQLVVTIADKTDNGCEIKAEITDGQASVCYAECSMRYTDN